MHSSLEQITLKMNLHSIRFSSVFLRFCFSMKMYALFHPHFIKSISALSRLLHEEKMLFKNVVYDQYLRYFKIELYSFTKNFFPKTFVQYVTVWVVRRWTYKKRIKSAYFFTENKTVKKRTKTDEKRILCKSIFTN